MHTDRNWLAPPNAILPQGQEVHVWRASLAAEPEEVARFSAMLSPEEQSRADRFRFPEHRDAFVAAHGILRELLGRTLAKEPSALAFSANAYGKPCFPPGSQFADIHFNLSHSGGRALYAIAKIGEVGVDLEQIRPLSDLPALANRVLSPREAPIFFSLPPSVQVESFFTCWTRKEAYLKARGEGFRIEPSSFEVTFAPGAPAAIVGEEYSEWTLRELAPAAGYVGAVAVKATAFDLKLWDWQAAGTNHAR
jgi:4'-phosphopantetheinyl transferase